MYITEKMANFIYHTSYNDLDETTILLAKERILDTLGCYFAGYSHWDYTKNLIDACRQFDKGNCSIIGSKEKEFSVARAAMISSTLAHAVELDDGHKNAGVHAGAVVVPTALILGEYLGKSGTDVLTAVVIGYEVVYRIAANANPMQIRKGFHPSGNCDAFGALAVAGKLMGLSKEQLANGLGLVGLHASGLMEATQTGQQSKCIMLGNAAYNGVACAYLAQNDLEGTVSILEGENGFFNAQSEGVNVDLVCKDLGKKFMIGDTYNKLYPTCRHSQPAIEAVIDILEKEKIDANDIIKINVGTHQVAYNLTGKIYKPKDSGEAKFSLPYGVALAIEERSVTLSHLTEKYRENEKYSKISDKVHVCVDEYIQSLYPGKRGALVEIILKNGRIFKKEYFDLKGSPNNPIGWEELKMKFIGNVKDVINHEKISSIISGIYNIDKKVNMKEILENTYC